MNRTYQAIELRSPCCNRKVATVKINDHVHSYNKTCGKCFTRYVVITQGTQVRWIPKDIRQIQAQQHNQQVLRKALPAPSVDNGIIQASYLPVRQKKRWWQW